MDNTRLFAMQLLRAVIDQRRPLDEALDRLPPGEARDRAAAHRLAATVLRRAGTLDAVLEPHMKRSPPDAVRLILRLGAAQLLLLDTPAHAAVATSVALARAQKLAPFSGMVNAVLRRVAEAGAGAMEELDSPRLDTPAWLWASWGSQARAIAVAHQTEAPLDLTLMPGGQAPDGSEMLPTGSARLPSGTRVVDLPGLAAGTLWVQDAAAALPARLLAARPGEHVADLCAAPGGKAAQLAAAGAHVVAVEASERRLPRLRDNLARLRLAVEIVPRRRAGLAAGCPAGCGAAGRALFGHRHHPPPPRPASHQAAAGSCRAHGRPGQADRGGVCDASAGRKANLRGLLPAGRGGARSACRAWTGSGSPLRRSRRMNLSASQRRARLQERYGPIPRCWAEKGGLDGFFAARFVKT